MRAQVPLAALVALVLLATPVRAGPFRSALALGPAHSAWPMLGGNPFRTASSTHIGPTAGRIAWKYGAGGAVSSAPAVGLGGTLYFAAPNADLHAVSPGGAKQWSFDLGDFSGSPPAIADDGTVYAGASSGVGGLLFAVDSAGNSQWSYPLGFAASGTAPAIAKDGTIVAHSYQLAAAGGTDVVALGPDGAYRWASFDAQGASPPAIANDGTVYVSDKIGLLALSGDTGATKWHRQLPGEQSRPAMPAIGGDGTIYVTRWLAANKGRLYAIRPNGSLKWQVRTAEGSMLDVAIAANGTILFAAGRTLFAVGPDGDVLWKYRAQGSFVTSPVVDGAGTAYAGVKDGIDSWFIAVDAQGKLTWRLPGVAPATTAAIGEDGSIYFGSEDGSLYALEGGGEAADRDGDAIPDEVERQPGYRGKGGSPDHRDLWVECDYMRGRKPSAQIAKWLTTAFARAPLSNPDGKRGITLHLTIDDEFPFERQWGNVDSVDGFEKTYQRAMDRRKKSLDGDPAYTHYCLFVNAIDDGSGSGISLNSEDPRAIVPGDTFLVSLGRFRPPGGAAGHQAGTLMHELGHNLGLLHGGGDRVGYKPNYLSVMNYHYQGGFFALTDDDIKQLNVWDYSRFRANTLDEDRLDENRGVRVPAPIARRYIGVTYCYLGGRPDPAYFGFNTETDWDCDGNVESPVAADLNDDGRMGVLRGHNDWRAIVFDGGAIGGAGSVRGAVWIDPGEELDYETQRKLERLLGRDADQ